MASIATAFSASAILFVHEGNTDHALMFTTKIIEGISSSFIAPCVAALVSSHIFLRSVLRNVLVNDVIPPNLWSTLDDLDPGNLWSG